jgi:pimeloyl-ACP methyl ester carboxylesterase
VPILQLGGADLHYETHGKGPPLLLISGTACDGEFWKPYQVPEFSRDHTVITFDQRGTGKTIHGNDYSTRCLAADAARLIEEVGLGPAIVWGYSMGGRVAQLVALDHPASVKRLILASTGASFKAKGTIPGYLSRNHKIGLRALYPGAFHRDWLQQRFHRNPSRPSGAMHLSAARELADC